MKLWKENLLAKEYQMSTDDILQEFIKSDCNKDIVRGFEAVLYFITSPEGLDSAIDVPMSKKDEDELINSVAKYSVDFNWVDYLAPKVITK